MRRTLQFRHTVGVARVAGLAIVLGLSTALPAAKSETLEPNEPAARKIEFSPDIEQKLARFFEEAITAKRAELAKRLTADIADVQEVTGLDAEKAKALQGPANAALDHFMADWSVNYPRCFRKNLEAQISSIIDRLLQNPASNIEAAGFVENVLEDEAAWKEGLQRILAPAQAAIWNKTAEERLQAKLSAINAALDGPSQSALGIYEHMTHSLGEHLKAALELPPAMADQLDILAKSTAQDCLKRTREVNVKSLLALDEDDRRMALRRGGMDFRLRTEDREAMERIWNTGLAKTLSPEDLKRWRDFNADRRARHMQVYTGILISEMDRRVALTAQQRQLLEPLAFRLLERAPLLGNPDIFSSDQYRRVIEAATIANRAELDAILDPAQVDRWEHCRQEESVKMNSVDDEAQSTPDRRAADLNEPPPAPEEVENRLAEIFEKKEKPTREAAVAELTLRAEDAARCAMLPQETVRRLQTGAKAAVEIALASWKDDLEENIRGVVGGGLPGDVNANIKRLSAESRVADNPTFNYFAKSSSIIWRWDHVVDTTLTPAQRALWQKELDARARYRDEAISRCVLALFEMTVMLTSDQRARLEPLVTEVIKEYGDDFSASIPVVATGTSRSAWYLSSYKLMPIAALSENDRQAILTEAENEIWTKSAESVRCNRLWPNLQHQHEKSLKSK